MYNLFDSIDGDETSEIIFTTCESCGTAFGSVGRTPGCYDPDGCGMLFLVDEEAFEEGLD